MRCVEKVSRLLIDKYFINECFKTSAYETLIIIKGKRNEMEIASHSAEFL